jgi:hypothetical protein
MMFLFFSSIFTPKGEAEGFICKALKGEAIFWLLRALNNAADETLRLVQNPGFIFKSYF